MNSYYTEGELSGLGLKHVGKGVRLSRKVSLYGSEGISIGDYSRIDDYCILSGEINIGRYVHIAAYSALFGGKAGIVLEDCATVSSRNSIYAANDDYSGMALSSGAPEDYRQITSKSVCLKFCSILGSGCVVLPGVTLEEGAAVGALSLVNSDVPAWSICGGVPCQKLKERKKNMRRLANQLLAEKHDYDSLEG